MTTTVTIPTLETDRLTVRAPRKEDFGSFARFQASPRAEARGWLMTEDEAYNHFTRRMGEWVYHGYGWFTLERKSDMAPIGYTGMMHQPFQPEPEIGWTIWEDGAEGKGYAYEAARSVLNFVFSDLKLSTIVSYIHPDNLRSIKLAERLGAKLDGQWTTPSGKLVDVWRHPNEVLA